MLRHALAALAVVAAGLATTPPATAAASRYVVYEVARARPGGPAEVKVGMALRQADGRGLYAVAHLEPAKRGYDVRAAGVGQLLSGGGWRTYGWPVAAPACPVACGGVPDTWTVDAVFTFRPVAGDRILVGGPRATTAWRSLSPHWEVRETRLALRAVYAEEADATGVSYQGRQVAQFRSASAAAGPHGSLGFGSTGCGPTAYSGTGAGTATFSSDDGKVSEDLVCAPMSWPFAFGTTYTARGWSLRGSYVGVTQDPLRLLVMDYPKR